MGLKNLVAPVIFPFLLLIQQLEPCEVREMNNFCIGFNTFTWPSLVDYIG